MTIVREKVTQTSRPNRSLTNTRDLCVCVFAYACLTKLKPDLWNPKKQWQDNRPPIFSSFMQYLFLNFPCPSTLFYTAIQRKSQWKQENRAAWKSNKHAHGNTCSQDANVDEKMQLYGVLVKAICQTYIQVSSADREQLNIHRLTKVQKVNVKDTLW